MKLLILLFVHALFLSPLYASQDSVGVFYKPEKVIVLIEEKKVAPRLNGFMNALSADNEFRYESYDKNLRIACGRNSEKAVCTFTVLPGALGKISHRKVEAFIPAIEFNFKNDYEMSFESSMQDRFYLKINSEGLEFTGTKKTL